MKNLKLIILLIFLIGVDLTAEQPAWELVSMNPQRGTIMKLVKGEKDNIFLIGSPQGDLESSNIFFSSDKGEHWKWLHDVNMYNLIELNGIFYSGVFYFDKTGFLQIRYCKSYDHGDTWSEIKNSWKYWATAYLGVCGNSITAISRSSDECFYSSTDEGNTWELKGTLKDNGETKGLCFPSQYQNVILSYGESRSKGSFVYLSLDTGRTWNKFAFENSQILGSKIKSSSEIYNYTDDGIWLTTDSCKTWVKKYLSGYTITSFDISIDHKNIIASVSGYGVYYSVDYGSTWFQSEEFKDRSYLQNHLSNLLIDYNICLGTPAFLGLYLTTDNGKTWEDKNNGLSFISPWDFIILPNNNFYTSFFGVFKSTDSGKYFSLKGMRDIDFKCLAYNKKGYIFAGQGGYTSQGNGIYRSKDAGETWDDYHPMSTEINAIIIDSSDIIYAALTAGNVIRSTNDGETWINTNTETSYLGINDEGHLFSFASGYIFRSTDKGLSWYQQAYTQLDPAYYERGGRIIFNNKTKTAAYYDLMTTDNGRTWFKQTDLGVSFGTTESNHFAVDSLYNWIYAGSSPRILKSEDNGKNWHRMDTTGLMHSSYGPVAVSPDGHIYVFGNTGGLYRSRDRFVSVQEQLKPDNSAGSYSASDYFEFHYTYRDYYDNKITIFNIFGEEVFRGAYSADDNPMGGTKQINISFLPEGVYFVRIGNRTEKFVRM